MFDKRESISRGLMSLYWVSEGVDHEKRLRNGAVADRMQRPEWRQFTNDQVHTITAYEAGNYYLDRTSSFSVRPPEFRIIPILELCLRLFVWETVPKANIQTSAVAMDR